MTMPDPTHINNTLAALMARLGRRWKSDEYRREQARREQAERRRLEAATRATAHARLAGLRKQLPDHYGHATQYKRAQWTKIREALRVDLEASPRSWVLMASPPGNAKTTALVAEGIRAIREGRSVVFVSAPEWRELVLEKRLGPARECDLLLLDELHMLPSLPAWVLGEVTGVIEGRSRRKRERQVLGAGTAPITQLIQLLPPGIGDRFDARLGASEPSQRRTGR
jgi:DNA replication protein DnaC